MDDIMVYDSDKFIGPGTAVMASVEIVTYNNGRDPQIWCDFSWVTHGQVTCVSAFGDDEELDKHITTTKALIDAMVEHIAAIEEAKILRAEALIGDPDQA